MYSKKLIGLVMVLLVVAFFYNVYGASAAQPSIKNGYCCAAGKVFPATKEECAKQKGTYHDSKLKAAAACKPQQGYCCADGAGKVFPATKEECAKQKGTYYDSKTKADQACKAVKGYCYAQEKVFPATQKECAKQKGTYYDSKIKADQASKSLKGYCCANGKVFGATPLECKIKKGRLFSSIKQAKEACASVETEPAGVPKSGGDLPDERRDWPLGPDDGSSSGEVRVTVTEAGETVRPGSTITARYEIDEPLPGSVNITLRHYVGGAVADIRTLYEGAPQTDRDVRLLLPADMTGEDHRIYVATVGEDTARSGESAGFDILGLPSTRDELNLSFIGRPSWYMTPVEGAEGEPGSLSYAVSCDGGGCEGQTFEVGLMLDGTLAETQTLTAVEALQTLIYWEPPNCGGTWELVIDPDNLLAETDETDNTASGTVDCIAWPETEKPDLFIYSASVDPWPLVGGGRVDFHYSLFNGGRFGEVTTGPFTVALKVGGVVIRSNRHTGMTYTADHSEMVEGTFTVWWFTCGEPIELVVDSEDEVDEGDETNNVYDGSGGVVPFECVPASLDLWVSLFSVSDDDPEVEAGRTKTYTADIIAVRGDPRNVRVRCGIVGGEVLHEEVLTSLDVMEIDAARRGERISFDAALCPAGSTFRLYCEVDPDGAIAETDETNNRQEYEMTTVADPRYTCP